MRTTKRNYGNFGLTPEELDAKAVKIKQRHADKSVVRSKNWVQHQLATNADARRAGEAATMISLRSKSPGKHVAETLKTRDKARASNKYYCKPRDLTCRTNFDLKAHKKTKKHLRKTGQVDPTSNLQPAHARAVANKTHYWMACDLACKSRSELETHKTKSNLRKVTQIGVPDSSSMLD